MSTSVKFSLHGIITKFLNSTIDSGWLKDSCKIPRPGRAHWVWILLSSAPRGCSACLVLSPSTLLGVHTQPASGQDPVQRRPRRQKGGQGGEGTEGVAVIYGTGPTGVTSAIASPPIPSGAAKISSNHPLSELQRSSGVCSGLSDAKINGVIIKSSHSTIEVSQQTFLYPGAVVLVMETKCRAEQDGFVYGNGIVSSKGWLWSGVILPCRSAEQAGTGLGAKKGCGQHPRQQRNVLFPALFIIWQS